MANYENANNGYTLRLTVNEIPNSINIENNTSQVSWELKLIATSYNYFSNWEFLATANVDGEVYNQRAYRSISQRGTLIIASGTKTITHNTDGTKSISVGASIYATGESYMPGNISVSGTFTLSTIPRASTITAIDANIESATIINIKRASTSFTHTITYSFFDLTDTITTKTSETSLGWTIPSSFYAKIPNAKSGTVTLTCTTYSGNTNIGTKTTTFKVTASEDECKPDISAVLIDSNSTTVNLSTDNTKLIKYKSTAKITPTATAKNSATISSIKVNNIEVVGSYLEIENVESETFDVIVTDSRGYTNNVILNPIIIPYMPLTLSIDVTRETPTSDRLIVSYSGNGYGDKFNDFLYNTIFLRQYYRNSPTEDWSQVPGQPISVGVQDDKFNGQFTFGVYVSYQQSVEVKIEAFDALTVAPSQQKVSKGIPYFDYGIDANGDNYFNVNGTIYENNGPITTKQEIITGVECPTNEYLDNKQIYIKVLEFTDNIGNGVSNRLVKPHGIVGATAVWVDLSNSWIKSWTTARFSLPSINYNGNNTTISLIADASSIYMEAIGNSWDTSWTKHITLRYTK